MLTSRSRSFHHTSLIETGMSDFRELILSLYRALFKRIPAKTIEYRNYGKFRPETFLHELDQELKKGIIYNSQDKQHDLFSNIFRTILDHHAPLKAKRIRDNQVKFMTKELSKSIMDRSRLKNRYLRWPSHENFLAYKKAENLCNTLNKKAKNTYFGKATEKPESWVVKSFGVQSNLFFHQKASFIIMAYQLKLIGISIEIYNKIIKDKSELAKIFNSHYINILKSTTGKHPTKLETSTSRVS